MSETARPLLGFAAQITDLFGGKIPVLDLYGSDGSHLYDKMMGNDRAEVDDFLAVADARRPESVLELAAGNGRTTIPFLEHGHTMVGLDSSPHMLQRLKDKLQTPELKQYADKLTTVEADMSDFSLGQTFDLIVLGMGTVWMLDEDARASLFASVHRHLNDGGRFLLTLPEHPGVEGKAEPVERRHIFRSHDSASPVLCTLIEYFDPHQKLRLMSILSQRVQDGAITRTELYAHWNHLISATLLEKEIERAGLQVVSRRDVENTHITTVVDEGRHRWLIEVGK